MSKSKLSKEAEEEEGFFKLQAKEGHRSKTHLHVLVLVSGPRRDSEARGPGLPSTFSLL